MIERFLLVCVIVFLLNFIGIGPSIESDEERNKFTESLFHYPFTITKFFTWVYLFLNVTGFLTLVYLIIKFIFNF